MEITLQLSKEQHPRPSVVMSKSCILGGAEVDKLLKVKKVEKVN